MGKDGGLRRVKTGIAGLDDILGGGLLAGQSYLLEGSPGTGKTTLALKFLLEGAEAGERGLYITLSETEAELRAGAASHGWRIGDGIEIFEPVPPEMLDPNQRQSLLYSSAVSNPKCNRAAWRSEWRGKGSGSRALVAGDDASAASTLEADVFSRQTLPCCVCRFFWRSDGRLSLRGTAHLTEEKCPKAISI